MRARVTLTIVALALALVLLRLWKVNVREAAHPMRVAGAVENVEPERQIAREPTGAARSRPSEEPPRARVLFTDERGSPVPRARLLATHANARILEHGLTTEVGTADDEGVLVLPVDGLPQDMLAFAAGFLSTPVARAALQDGEATVVLRRGLRQIITCRDLEGNPLAGVPVFLSRAQLPAGLDSWSQETLAGGTSDAVYGAVTNELGVAEVAVGAAGRHRLGIRDPGFTIVSGDTAANVPGAPIALVLGTLMAGVFRVESDEVAGFSFQMLDVQVVGLRQSQDVKRARSLLEARFPGDLVVVGARISAEPLAWLRMLLKHSGLQLYELELQPLVSVQPKVLEIVSMGSPCLPVELEVLDASRRSIEMDGFDVLIGNDLIDGVTVALSGGSVAWLPAGSYPLSHSSPWVHDSIPEGTRIEPGARATVVLEDTFRRCELVVEDPSGCPLDAYRMSLSPRGMERALHVTSERLSTYLPVGEASYRVECFGYPPSTGSFEVAVAEPASAPLEIVLRLSR